jgi:hypothetical protein
MRFVSSLALAITYCFVGAIESALAARCRAQSQLRLPREARHALSQRATEGALPLCATIAAPFAQLPLPGRPFLRRGKGWLFRPKHGRADAPVVHTY